jgi:hypothetical protein
MDSRPNIVLSLALSLHRRAARAATFGSKASGFDSFGLPEVAANRRPRGRALWDEISLRFDV